MAIFQQKLTDETFEKYRERSKTTPQKAIEATLERFKEVDPEERALLFIGETRKALEKLFGFPIESEEKFVEWVKRLTSANIADLDFPLKPGQRKKLEGLALFYKQPFSSFVQAFISRILDKELGGF